ncbi:hypothetical protein P4O66_020940 [Electrophorus voltai]|uniref:SCP domain-containing protein n=1 Tax=Electrophorus voltai TaxID=2609070 RepID=A0AAD9E3X4_9TELE|nr:hypothetical protein P4O66_020940 [Electrophorus voltai]
MAPAGVLHCTLLWLTVAAVASLLTKEQRDSIVDQHNIYRASVNPKAADMTRMTWNENATLVAEKYASQCIWDHNPAVKNIFGESLFTSTGPINVSKVLHEWFKEHEHYDYDNNQCSEDEQCRHYTQMVWAKSTSVGCAAHVCATLQGLPGFTNTTIVVCNYFPLGNVVGHKPYQAGEPCSQCPENWTLCEDNVCGPEHKDILPSTETEHGDILPSTETEHGDILPSTETERGDILPSTETERGDILPSTETERGDILPSTETEQENNTRAMPEHAVVASKAGTGTLILARLLLAGLIASLVF